MAKDLKTPGEIADIKSREDDLVAAGFYQVVKGIKTIDLLKDTPNIEQKELVVNGAMRTTQKSDDSVKATINLLQEVCTIICAIGIDKALEKKNEINKAMKAIPDIKGTDVAYLLRGLLTVGHKFLTNGYKIKNNLVDFNQNKDFTNKEYKLSLEVLHESIAYDLYTNIAYPLSQIVKLHPAISFAIELFDIAIKAKHLAYGYEIVDLMGVDIIYDACGISSAWYKSENTEPVTPANYANHLIDEDMRAKIGPVVTLLDTLKENIYGVKKSDIIQNQYYENIFDEVFVLAQETGNFKDNIKHINELAEMNPDESVLDIANYVMYTVRANHWSKGFMKKKASDEGYWDYKEDLEYSLEYYLANGDEDGYIIETFNKFYNITDGLEKVNYIPQLMQVLAYNNKIKSKYSQKTRMQMLITLFNEFPLNELSKRLSIEELDYNQNEKEQELIIKLTEMYPEQFREEGHIFSSQLLKFHKGIKTNTSGVQPRRDASYQSAMEGLTLYLDGFANKYDVGLTDLNYIIHSIATDYDRVGINKITRRVEMTDSLLANNEDIDPKKLYDFVVENEDSIYEEYQSVDNMQIVELEKPIKYSGHPDHKLERKMEKIRSYGEIAYDRFEYQKSIENQVESMPLIPYVNTEIKNNNDVFGNNSFDMSYMPTGANMLYYPSTGMKNDVLNFTMPTGSGNTPITSPITPSVIKISDDKVVENRETIIKVSDDKIVENDLHNEIVIKIVANLNRVRMAQ